MQVIHPRLVPVFLGWILAVSLPAMATLAKPSPPSLHELESRVEEYMTARVKRDHFSGSILIAREGKVLFSKGYGMANLEHDVPNTPQTKYRLGSITKQFTAMAILILQEQGKLNVHDKIKKYLPDAPKAWDEITIEHLLTHTSGIYNYTESLEFLKTLPVRVTLKELIAKFKDKPLNFKPGEKYSYSNSGYIVLGQIIETASGQNYPSFLKQAIFDPLAMTETGYDNATSILKHRASGYTRRLGIVLTNCDYVDMSIPHAAGALYSTTLDLLKWDQALYTEKLVPRKSLDAMFTPHKDNYGYGWMIDKKFGQTRYRARRWNHGFRDDHRALPRREAAGRRRSATSKTRPSAQSAPTCPPSPWDSATSCPASPRWPSSTRPSTTPTWAATRSMFRGTARNKKRKKTKTRTSLARFTPSRAMAHASSVSPLERPRFLLTPESDTVFYIKSGDSEARFVKDPAGKVTALVLIEDGQDVTARRVPAKAK